MLDWQLAPCPVLVQTLVQTVKEFNIICSVRGGWSWGRVDRLESGKGDHYSDEMILSDSVFVYNI